MSRMTLRELNGFDPTPAKLADATLILIDFQDTYTQGVMELDGWEESLDAAAQLLARAREAGTRIVHVINDGGEGTPYDIRAEIGSIHSKVAPVDGEPVVVKQVPNAFVGTDLDTHLKEGQDVVIAGWMTHMCVAFTAQGAFLNGNRPTVVAEATATRSLPVIGTDLDARQVHDSALATIADLYGVVVATQKEIV
ncbi:MULTISPECIES: isochorismatase family protein [unclassified Streptomyces]|uniref:isochorismatase family protein n=1 Tax=unclassified Streptomyces TaxID=2593676 RepID=UPI00136DD902|nr:MULTISPECIES: isochorismatase family protein [unclassified Streptomyces]NEA04951.1 isochorismatase family protein [Streptomyces sp. SID10116]MYY82578.1 isochorismatase family protein [Streptomyces sp. SID335]MYZ11979.1 isochorismatase family protein [Streptomyces sp. SID337]NDZ91421.1 isochorismatase family protein [Streptomyces sp. SID10115]NEB45267.1 isochorismatase family protein [Streptomyces sp. SID339]